MAKIVECDRCGARIKSRFGTAVEVRRNVPFKSWDLCDRCLEALHAWLKGEAEDYADYDGRLTIRVQVNGEIATVPMTISLVCPDDESEGE